MLSALDFRSPWPWLAIGILYFSTRGIYNVYFHPLSRFPGPKLWAAFRSIWIWSYTSGSHHHRIKKFHDRYGPVVRVAPDELSFIDGSAWQDIYTKGAGNKGLERSLGFIGTQPVPHVFDSNGEDHTRVRRKLMISFSDQALASQEHVIQQYVSKMIDRVRQTTATGESVNIADWLNWFAFDLIGELGFSESFDQLEKGKSHSWIVVISAHVKSIAIAMSLNYYPTIKWLLPRIAPGTFSRLLLQFVAPTRDKVHRRLTRPDSGQLMDMLATFLPHNNDGEEIIDSETLIGVFSLIIVAGSETSATTLTALINLLTEHPRVMRKLHAEIRQFAKPTDLTLSALAQLPYTNAVIKEGLRLCHPVPPSSSRVTPPEGKTIAGYHVPGNTTVVVPHYAAYRSDANFTSAAEFYPERWLGGKDPGSSVFQPFMVGGHSCVGQNLAQAELRLALARLVYEFDIEAVENFRWEDQASYIMWQKKPLLVHLKDAAKASSTT
ncbi:cytochrome P450 [Aspergillus crustosus]